MDAGILAVAAGVYFTSLSEDCQRVLGMLNTSAGGHIVYRSSTLMFNVTLVRCC